MTGRAEHPRRASTRTSYAVARGSEDEGGEERLETDKEVVPKKRDKGKGRAVEVIETDEEEDEVETDEDDASDWEESRKETKKSKSAGKKGGKGGGASAKKGGRKGKDVGRLEVMKMLPLELLVEIFSYLDPDGLLALSMVDKQYHSLLTSPGSKKVWEESRKRLDLPDNDVPRLTEQQYARLVLGHFAYLPDLLAFDRILRDLEAQDEDEMIASGLVSSAPGIRVPHEEAQPRPRQRKHRRNKKYYSATAQHVDSESESEDEFESARVAELVKARQVLRKSVVANAEQLVKAESTAQKELSTRARRFDAPVKNWERQDFILAEVAGLGYTAADVEGLRRKVVSSAAALSSEEWEKIKPQVLRALDGQRAKRLQCDTRDRQFEVLRSLRTHYKSLKRSLPPSARPFMPLFVDFLVLPLVKELWQPGKKVTSEEWEAPPTLKDRYGAVGPLLAVLQHQHVDHNDDKQLPTIKAFGSEPKFRITLPLEVACAISALLDIGELDTDSAGQSDLDQLNKMHFFEWENAKTRRRFFYDKQAWQELVFFIKRRGEKLAKLKNPQVLDPPCIVMKKSGWEIEREARLAAAAAKKAGGGVQATASAQGRAFDESSEDVEKVENRDSSPAPVCDTSGADDSDSDDDDQTSEDEQPAQRSVKVERDDSSVGSSEEDE
ncbi:hypothetical protein JCM10296v2_006260 [Rhodotorula toruloides]